MSDDEVSVLAEDVGEWDTELAITPFPGAPTNVTAGTATNRLVGGRWLVTDQSTESGYEGHGVYGWDAATGGYVGFWVDGMGAGVARGTGTWDPTTRTMSYDMAVDHEGTTYTYRETTQRLDDGSRLYSNVVPVPDGHHEVIRATFRPRA